MRLVTKSLVATGAACTVLLAGCSSSGRAAKVVCASMKRPIRAAA